MCEVARAIGTDSRIGPKFLNAGPGKSAAVSERLNLVYLCRHFSPSEVADYKENVAALNTWQQHRIARLVVQKLFGTVTGKRLAILGFAFKADTNDTRETQQFGFVAIFCRRGRWPFTIPRWLQYARSEREAAPQAMLLVTLVVGLRPIALKML